MHHLVRPEEVKLALGPGGALETFLKAKEEGKIKFLGFSAHTTKAAVEALKGFAFDTVMFPINFVEFYRSYRPPTEVELEELRKIAATCESVFQKEEAQLTSASPCRGPVFPDSPHECGCGHFA